MTLQVTDSDVSDEIVLSSNQELAFSEDDPSPYMPLVPSNSAPIIPSIVSGSHPALGLLDPKLSDARRRQLDAINRMHSLGVQRDIDLPQIVVIGSQGAGKSSLIESISGITLPRASGTCTRCPIECHLVHSTEPWQCLVSLRFLTDEADRPLARIRNIPFGAPINDPDEVEERLRRAQQAVLNPAADPALFLWNAEDRHVNALQFTTNCVSLQISGPEITDLSFCDLPGLIASVSDHSHEDDVEKVAQLVSSYISKSSCIILLTVACESDFETQGAYRLAKQHDTDGVRTIGVLTKPDRIPQGEGDRWIRLIKNESSALKNGWFCVKQPSTAELQSGITFEEARHLGESFFMSTPWSTLEMEHQKRLGTQAVTKKLNQHLMTVISTRFPELMRELEIILRKTKAQLQKLPRPAFKDPVLEVMHLIGDFGEELFRRAEGNSQDSQDVFKHSGGTTTTAGGNHFEPIAKAQETFRRAIISTAPDFRPFRNDIVGNPDRVPASPPPFTSPYDYACVPSAPQTPMALPSDGIREPEFLLHEQADHLSFLRGPIYLHDVVEQVQRATTRELPGYYPFHVLQGLISRSTDQWEEPARALVDSIHETVVTHQNSLIKKYFGDYTEGGLRQTVSTIMQEYMQERRDGAVDRVKWLLELEAHAFTLNKHYLHDYREKFLKFYRDQQRNARDRGMWATPDEPLNPNQFALEIMATVRAYFQVAYKRVVDTIPLAIDRELVRVQKRAVLDALSGGLEITSPEARAHCQRLLAEPSEVVARRGELENQLARLTAAQKEMVNVSAGSP